MYESQIRRARKKPLHLRELLYTYPEIAQTLDLSMSSIYRFKKEYADFPSPITSKAAVMNWARRHGIPRQPGPSPSRRRAEVVRLREQGKTFSQIGQVLGISRQAAHQLWTRHLERN